MKDKIVRTKEFVQRHRTAITFNAGVAVGVGAAYYTAKALYGGKTLLPTSPELLQKLIDEPTGGIEWKHPLGTIIAINEANPSL